MVSLAGPVDAMFGKSTIDGLWPSTLEYSFDELGSIALPIGVCMFLAVCKLVPRDEVFTIRSGRGRRTRRCR